jgi:hypothetical protein
VSDRRTYGSNAQRQAAYRLRVRQAQESLLLNKGLPPPSGVPNVAGWSRWNKAMRQTTALLEQIVSEMAAYSDGRSERWLESEVAENFQERLDRLQEIIELANDWT